MTPQDFFDKVFPARFDSSKAASLEAIIQMSIAGPAGGEWTVTIKDQKLDIKKGMHPSPSLSIKMADTDFVDMINGKLPAEGAFMTGKLKFKGSIGLALKLKDIGFL